MSDVFQMYFSWFLFFYYYTTEVVTLLSLFAQLWIISLFPSSFLSGHTLWKNDFKSPIDIIASEALLYMIIFEFSLQKYYILLLFEVLRQKWPGLAQNWLMILLDDFFVTISNTVSYCRHLPCTTLEISKRPCKKKTSRKSGPKPH